MVASCNRCYQVEEEIILTSNKGRAYFGLSGYHFNPDDITHILGIQPTTVNAAGASSGIDKPVISTWELSTDLVTGNVDIYDLTDIIIKQLEPVKEKILQVKESHNLSPRVGVVLDLSVDKGEISPDVGLSFCSLFAPCLPSHRLPSHRSGGIHAQ